MQLDKYLKEVKPGDLTTSHMKLFLYGKSFVGKTYFASTFPGDIIVASTDGNYKNLSKTVYPIDILNEMDDELPNGALRKVSGWLYFKELVRQLRDNPQFEAINTVIVDLVKDIYDMCREYVLRREGVIHESEIKAQGKSWTLIDSEFVPVIRSLMTLPKHVVLIANEIERDGKYVPDTIDSLTKKIVKYSDLCGRFYRTVPRPGQSDNGTRTLSCTSDFKQEGGNRFSIGTIEIANPTFDKLIETINNSPKEK